MILIFFFGIINHVKKTLFQIRLSEILVSVSSPHRLVFYVFLETPEGSMGSWGVYKTSSEVIFKSIFITLKVLKSRWLAAMGLEEGIYFNLLLYLVSNSYFFKYFSTWDQIFVSFQIILYFFIKQVIFLLNLSRLKNVYTHLYKQNNS